MPLQVVAASPSDAGELYTLQRASFVDEALELGSGEIPPLTETLDALRNAFNDVLILKAFENSDGPRILGTGRLRVVGSGAWIERLAIAPDCQGRGVGGAILQALEQAAPTTVTRIELHTAEIRSLNHRFYERNGYQCTGRVEESPGIWVLHYVKERASDQVCDPEPSR